VCACVVAASADVSDHEQDPIKLNSLPPGKVDLDGVAVQITCGLQHTGLSVCLSVHLSASKVTVRVSVSILDVSSVGFIGLFACHSFVFVHFCIFLMCCFMYW